MRIYLTHCSARKNDVLKNTRKRVTPDKLYTATPTQRFMHKCIEKRVNWAIISDLYGVYFPDAELEWYDKNPDTITDDEFRNLLHDFDRKLQRYNEIWFYHNPGRFHSLYRRLLKKSKLKDKIKRFTHLSEII